MAMLHPDTPLQERPFELDPQFPTIDLDTELPQNQTGFTIKAQRAVARSVQRSSGLSLAAAR